MPGKERIFTMKKTLTTLAAALCIAGANAFELDCTFDKKQPAGLSISGTVQQENGASVLVNDKGYYIGILTFTGEEGAGGTLTLDLTTTGNPPSSLGVILHEKQANGKLKALSHLAWMRKITADKYQTVTLKIAPGTFKAGKKYDIYFYRSNQKGALKIKRIQFKTTPAAK